MNKLTPYEQSLSDQLKGLPVPPSEEAWHQMEQLLDNDNPKRPVAGVPVRRGCALPLILLALLLAGIGAYFLHRNNWFRSGDKPSTAASTQDIKAADQRAATSTTAQMDAGGNKTEANVTRAGAPEGKPKDRPGSEEAPASVTMKTVPGESNVQIKNAAAGSDDLITAKREEANTPAPKVKGRNGKSRTGSLKMAKGTPVASPADAARPVKKRRDGNAKANVKVTIESPDPEETDIAKNNLQRDPVVSAADSFKKPGSTPVSVSADSLSIVAKTSVDSPKVKKEMPKKKHHFAAGIAVYKGLATNGAIDAAVNNSGRRNAASDYIPSVYIRYYKERKWFLQGEFRYGVPQYTKAFEYKKNLKVDAQQTVTTSSYKLRKTYYHQVPISFSYFILPGWSVGTGIMYNRFSGALSSESIRSANNRLVNDSLVSFNVIKDKNDSSFVKNTFQWLIETQYKWNRFSVGARYAKGLQPYIRYTDPETNLPVSKKSNSLYLFLRYELWSGR